ncbi:MAG: FecR domain-containing protein [Pseudomonadota bacterium]|nr:FecR domain-containing protein [Pseudomonadota bacterium]
MLITIWIHSALRLGALLWLTILLGITSVAHAASVALVIASRGEVVAVNEQGKRALQRRSTLFEGDRIETGNNSQVQIRFIDGALLTLEHQTKLEISRFEDNTQGKAGQVLLRLIQGGLRNLTGTIAEQHPERYRVESAVASIGVRGTDFRVVLRNNKLAAGVYTGGIVVYNTAGSLELGADRDFRFAWVTSPNHPPKGHLIAPLLLDDDSPQLQLLPTNEDVVQAIVNYNQEKTLTTLEKQIDRSHAPITPTPITPQPPPNTVSLPDWTDSAPITQRSFISATGVDSQGNLTQGLTTAAASNDKVTTPDGLVFDFSNSGSISTIEQAYILNGSNFALNQVDDLPIYWGKWNGDPELLLYQSQPSAQISSLAANSHELAWLYIQDGIINVDNLPNQGISRLDFHAKYDANGNWPLTSMSQNGQLSTVENTLSLGFNLNSQTVEVDFNLFNSDFTGRWSNPSSSPVPFSSTNGVISFGGAAVFEAFGTSSTSLSGSFSLDGAVVGGQINGSGQTSTAVSGQVGSATQELFFPGVMQLETDDKSQWSQLLFILEGSMPSN